MKDILIDSNLIKNIENPVPSNYKPFIKWLKNEGAIVLTNKLKTEYYRGNQNLSVIIDVLTRQKRVNVITNKQLSSFRFKKNVSSGFLSNRDDWHHLKAVCLSHRKMSISSDINFTKDVKSLPKFDGVKPTCESCPSKIKYE